MPDEADPSSSIPTSGEFDFVEAPPQEPRLRRRSLRARHASAPAPDTSSAMPPAADEPQPDRLEKTSSVGSSTHYAAPGSARPETAAPSSRPAASPSPSTGLYYRSSGPRTEKEVSASPAHAGSTPSPSYAPSASSSHTAPMKSSTAPAPAPSTAAVSTYRSAAATRPTTVSDFRANVERQSREQKSVGDVLSIIVYVLIGFVVLGAGLAGYGAYTLSRQIHQQSITLADLDARYAAANRALTQSLASTNDTLAQAQGQIRRQQELLVRQQDTINQLVAADNAVVAALHQERLTRASETAALRARVRTLEDQPHLNQ